MAKIEYQEPIKAVHGKISKDSEIIYKERNGTLYTQKATEVTSEPTAAQVAQRQKFKEASAQTNEIMTDIDKIEPYRQQFRNQKKYKTLRGFIFSKIMRSL